MNINLHFTAKNIEEIEKTTGSTVFELMNNSGISTILLFLKDKVLGNFIIGTPFLVVLNLDSSYFR